MRGSRSKPQRISVVLAVPPGAQSLDVVGPLDVFREATRQSKRRIVYSVCIMSLDREPILHTDGLKLVPDTSIYASDEPIDTLLVAGTPHVTDLSVFGDFYAWLRRRVPTVRRFGSVCTGVFFLGEAGLLSGRRVTTHWEDAAALAARYPEVILEADQIFVRDAALYTSAGVTAGIDLAMRLVEEDLGRDIAMIVARRLVVFLKRPGGQSQFSQHLAAQFTSGSRVENVQHWALENLAKDLSVSNLAERVGMSERNFSRVFLSETSQTVAEFVEIARVEAARQLLEDSAMPLQVVVVRCGFGTIDTMRRSFRRRLGITPHEYRLRFHP